MSVSNGCANKINSGDLVAELRQIDGEVTRSTTYIQDWIGRWILCEERRHGGLRLANLPGRNVFVDRIEKRKWVRTKSTQKRSPFARR